MLLTFREQSIERRNFQNIIHRTSNRRALIWQVTVVANNYDVVDLYT